MEQMKVDMFLIQNQKYFPADKIFYVKEKLKEMDDEKYLLITSVEYQDPTVMLLISIFLGYLGVDRFLLGEVGMGVLKLLTCGLFYVLMIMDWFTIQKKTKEKNFNKFMSML